MSNLTDLDPARLGDPDYELPMGPRITLGLQHVLAMFASNVTPSIIIAGAAGFAFGSADMVFLIQMTMLFAGVATLFQTIGFGPVGARLPVMLGTSFAFVPIMIGVVKSSGMAALMGSVIVAGIFGGLPNTSFSQNVGIVSMTGVMSRGVVTIGAIFLIICGFIPKIGAVVSSMPIEVLGGGVILMFGMVVSAGVSMLSTVEWSRRNMMILATSMSVGLGLQAVPKSMQHLPDTLGMLMTSGLLPVAVLAVVMNLLLPADAD